MIASFVPVVRISRYLQPNNYTLFSKGNLQYMYKQVYRVDIIIVLLNCWKYE